MGHGLTRRGVLRAVGGTAVGSLFLGRRARASARAQSGTWPEFGYDAANSGHATTNSGPVAAVERTWQFETGGDVVSSPAVVDGTVYVGSWDNTVYALSASDGSTEWEFATGDWISTGPAVESGTVYVSSLDSRLYALSASDGTERWRFETGDKLWTSPTVVDGTVYVGSDDANVYAISTDDGTEQWRYGTTGQVQTGPAVVDGTVYVGSYDGNAYALSASDGTEQWQTYSGYGRGLTSSIAVDGGSIYGGSYDGHVYALSTDDGSQQWEFETGDTVDSTPAVDGDTVYVGSNDGALYALSASDGTEQWSFDAGDTVQSSPSVVDGTVYVGSGNGTVYALAADDGTVRWRVETGAHVDASPAVVDGTVYVGSGDGNVYALTGETPTPTPTPTPSTVTVTLRTVDADSDPVGDVLLEVRQDGSSYSISTAANGEAFVDLLAGVEFSVRVTDTAYALAGPDSTYATSVDRSTTVTLEVTDAGTPTPADTPEPTETPEATATPEPTGTSTAATERPPTSTDEPAGASTTAGGNGAGVGGRDGGGVRELAPVVLAAVGLGGGAGALLMRRRGGDDGRSEREGGQSGPDDGSLADAGGTSTVGGGSSDSGGTSSAHGGPSDSSGTSSAHGGSSDAGGAPSPDDGRPAVDANGDRGAGPTTRTGRPSGAPPRADRISGGNVPGEIPRAPTVDVEYDALESRKPIGSGGNADVERATLPTADRSVTLAIKTPRMAGTLHSDAVERLLAEAETWSELDDHDHVVGVVDWGSDPLPWIAMEYMDGGHLGERAAEMGRRQRLWTAICVTGAVRHAHRHGVAHLDLKPANVLFRRVDSAWDVPKVSDWGLSKHLLDHSTSVEGMSPQYAAPEQFDDEFGPVDDITDVYQLGAVCYELFTGRPPFEGSPTKVMRAVMDDDPTPPSEVADVPDGLDEVLLTALAKDRGRRYDSVVYLRDALVDLYGAE